MNLKEFVVSFIGWLLSGFKPKPEPRPAENGTVSTNAEPVPLTEIVVWDGNTIADRMRQAGFHGRPTALWYALFQSYAGLPWDLSTADAEVLTLYGQMEQIVKWWDGEIDKVIAKLRSNPNLKAIIISNDGHDRGGFRIGPPTMERFVQAGLGDRVRMGEIYQY